MPYTAKTYISSKGAHYASREDFFSYSSVVETTEPNTPYSGIVMDYNPINGQVATSPEESHVLVVGGTGQGKSRRIIVPSILMLAKSKTSMIITDPKGELYRYTASGLRESKYDILTVNLRNPSKGDRWNPFSLIEKYYHSGDIELKDKATLMLSDIATLVKGSVQSGSEKYWENASSSLLIGIALLILEYGRPGQLTFENIAIVGRGFIERVQERDPAVKQFLSSLPPNSPILRNLTVAYQPNATKTVDNIASIFDTSLSMYVNQEALLDLLARSEIDFSSLGKKPTALFIILPDDSSVLYPLASVMIKQLYTVLIQEADANIQNNGVLDNKVVFLLDEIGTICSSSGGAVIPDFPQMLTASRSRGIKFVLVMQSIEQLRIRYSKYEAFTITGNCGVWMYLHNRNLEFLEYLQKLIGDRKSPYTRENAPLISIRELQELSLGDVLVLNKSCNPYIGHLPDFTEYDYGLFFSNEIMTLPNVRGKLKRKNASFIDLVRNPRPEPRKWGFMKVGDKLRYGAGVELQGETYINCLVNGVVPSWFDSDTDIEYCDFRAMEEILLLKNWKNKKEVISFLEPIDKQISKLKSYPDVLIQGFSDAFIQLKGMSFERMKEIIKVLNEDF